ncbi:F-box protein [Dorcoceras hygrometricum]|uniref:F-box protein n=1 Tax=Dorcoceras hygrometricum TaxID=472368 RepID=A0A2Z7D9L8_9LAMI|nr:F-box protein [Dorcoceras hygrometricum]
MDPRGEIEILGFDDDLFDRLPDELVLSIFNKLHDAKSLCLSMSVCKRFHSMVPKVDRVFLSVPWKRDRESEEISSKNSFKNIVGRALLRFKPIRFISRMMKFRSRSEDNSCDDCAHHVANDVLKPFDEMRALHLRLPCHGFKTLGSRTGDRRSNSTSFLKWKAEFGSQLQSCVIVGARSWSEKCESHEVNSGEAEQESRVMTEAELKLRIVWTLSCLIAASARHYLIQETVKDREMIENVVVSDESGQGVICMDKEQIEEMKDLKGDGKKGGLLSDCRSLRMKIWYAEKMEIPGCGKVMEGATLVVIRPDSGGDGRWRGRSYADLVAAAGFGGEGEEKVVGEFARKLVSINKCLTLEMNAF